MVQINETQNLVSHCLHAVSLYHWICIIFVFALFHLTTERCVAIGTFIAVRDFWVHSVWDAADGGLIVQGTCVVWTSLPALASRMPDISLSARCKSLLADISADRCGEALGGREWNWNALFVNTLHICRNSCTSVYLEKQPAIYTASKASCI